MQYCSFSLITVLLELTVFITSQVKFKTSHTCAQLELSQFCISPHNSKAWDNKLIAGLKFRLRSLRLRSDLNTAATR